MGKSNISGGLHGQADSAISPVFDVGQKVVAEDDDATLKRRLFGHRCRR